jgi:hypothetical protein
MQFPTEEEIMQRYLSLVAKEKKLPQAIRSNCIGTALYLAGVIDEDRYIPPGEDIALNYGLKQIGKSRVTIGELEAVINQISIPTERLLIGLGEGVESQNIRHMMVYLPTEGHLIHRLALRDNLSYLPTHLQTIEEAFRMLTDEMKYDGIKSFGLQYYSIAKK